MINTVILTALLSYIRCVSGIPTDPFSRYVVRPLAMNETASVPIKDSTLSLDTSTPFNEPINSPVRRHAGSIHTVCISAEKAPMAAENPRIAPTDKSSSPSDIKNMTPTEPSPMLKKLLKIFIIFLELISLPSVST